MSAPTDPIGPDNDLSQADALLAALIARGEARIRAIVHEEMEAARREAPAAEPASDPEPYDEDDIVERAARRGAEKIRLGRRIIERQREILAATEADAVSPRPLPLHGP